MYNQSKIKFYTNLTNCAEDLERFDGEEAMRNFCRKFGTEGFEYMNVCGHTTADISAEFIGGIHLVCHDSYVDFWRGNKEKLLEEFDTEENIIQEYGGLTRENMIQKLRRDLDLARYCQAAYVVFHVSEVRVSEAMTWRFHYTDQEVIEVFCELINELLDGQDYTFDFLLENLWWPGFRLDDVSVTRKLLEGIHYPKKGIMLDTGHLLHTNLELQTEEDGIDYILKCLEKQKDFIPYIKGIHLNQSLTGTVVKQMLAEGVIPKKIYSERWCQVFPYIFGMDSHQPFSSIRVREILEFVQPNYVTHELISTSRAEQEEMLKKQIKCLTV